MPRRFTLLATAAVTMFAVAGAAPAAPERDMVIRLGTSIGKIRLGMTLPQVRRALGWPHVSVYRQADFAARGRDLELGWELPGPTSWEPALWQVGFRSRSRRGVLRVVRVATTARAERTRQRIGVGSRIPQIVKAYPQATCVGRPDNVPHPGAWIVVRTGRGMTAFSVLPDRPHPDARNRVLNVMVQRTWYSPAGGQACARGWEDS